MANGDIKLTCKPSPLMLGALAALVVLFVLCLSGTLDRDDEIADADQYCEMVNEGLWPDYRQTYARECKDGRYVAPK